METYGGVDGSLSRTTLIYQDFLPTSGSLDIVYSEENASAENSEMNGMNETMIRIYQEAYFGTYFRVFSDGYREIHGQLSLFVCLLGLVANLLNIIVLTRKTMESPTNTILTGIAVSDLLVITSYIPYVIHNFFNYDPHPESNYSFGWAVFTLLHAHNTVFFHTVSIWLTVLLAVWRYMTVRSPMSNKSFYSVNRARMAVFGTYCLVPILCIPVFISFTVYPFAAKDLTNITLYKVDIVQLEGDNPRLLEKINFWMFSICLKLIPCKLLTALSIKLIQVLVEAKKRRERLRRGNFSMTTTTTAVLKPPTSNVSTPKLANCQQQLRSTGQACTTNLAPSTVMLAECEPGQLNDVSMSINTVPPYQCHESPETETNNCSSTNEVNTVNADRSNGGIKRLNAIMSHVLCCQNTSDVKNRNNNNNDNANSNNNRKVRSFMVLMGKNKQRKSNLNGGHISQPIVSSSGNSERTTKMLVAVLIMFLLCEFPSGILALLSGILGKQFFSNVYNNFGEIMDIMALINSAINFFLYCLMSTQFRNTFLAMFCPHWSTEEGRGFGGDNRSAVPSSARVALRKARPEPSMATEIIGKCAIDESPIGELIHHQEGYLDTTTEESSPPTTCTRNINGTLNRPPQRTIAIVENEITPVDTKVMMTDNDSGEFNDVSTKAGNSSDGNVLITTSV